MASLKRKFKIIIKRMKELLSDVFSEQYREDFLFWSVLCMFLVLLSVFGGASFFSIAIICALVSVFTVPLGIILLITVLIRRRLNPRFQPLTEIRLALLMVGLPFLAWPSYFLTNEVSLFVKTQMRYRAAEELIAELEQYKKQEGNYPFSTGRIPAGFASKKDCNNYHIGYCTQGDTYRVYFGLSSHLFTSHQYTYCADWSKLAKESWYGNPTGKLNWRVQTMVD
jgi:hypothetical protein